MDLISELIRDTMSIDCSVLMGANLANEVADEKFCETTIGCRDESQGQDFKLLFQTDNFRWIYLFLYQLTCLNLQGNSCEGY